MIANADTVMTHAVHATWSSRCSRGWRSAVTSRATQTLLSIDKARRVLGYEPQHSWRDELPGVMA